MLPQGSFSVILADPPWYFKTRSDKGRKKSPDQHYECMSFEDICALPISVIAAENSVLLMWTTDPFLEKAFEVIHRWGFTYKTVGFIWVKTNQKSLGFFKGLGYWTRANPEYCLLATRGRPKRLSGGVDKLIVSRRREHSRKPDETYDRIEQLLPGPYIELFARTDREGWTSWGDEVGKFKC